jgi:hypothetical protein
MIDTLQSYQPVCRESLASRDVCSLQECVHVRHSVVIPSGSFSVLFYRLIGLCRRVFVKLLLFRCCNVKQSLHWNPLA